MAHSSAAPAPDEEGFAEVTVRSEIARILAINVFTLMVAVLAIARAVLLPDLLRLDPSLLWFVGVGPLYAVALILYLRRLARRRRAIPVWLWFTNVVFESAMPTMLLAMLWLTGAMTAERALMSPIVLAYAIVLILSPLRLRPIACVVAGCLSAGGHSLLVVASHAAGYTAGAGVPIAILYFYGPWLLVAGLAAAFVASQLRAHVRNVLEQSRARQRAEHEIAVAAEIQQNLLPRSTPGCAGYRFAFWNRPADETGGDYYDWQPLPDGRLAVTLADVSGHGLGPALMAAFCRAYARATLHAEPALAAAVGRINELLTGDLPPGRFVTFVAALLTPGDETVHLLSAGHGPILVHRAAQRSVEVFPAAIPPLGVAVDTPTDQVTALRLAPGDALILVTDGFFEWANRDGARFGIERLRQTIIAAPAEPERTIEAMRTAVEEFAAGSAQTDDLTAVVIRRADDGAKPIA